MLPRVKGSREVMENVLETMPPFPENKSVNSLYALLNKDKDAKKEDEEVEPTPSIVPKVTQSNSGSISKSLPTASNKAKEVSLTRSDPT